MQLENMYWCFKSALTDEQCDNIIRLGESEMDSILKAGGAIDAKTKWEERNNHDHDHPAAKKKGSISLDDYTFEQIKRKKISFDDVFVRDTHVSWLGNLELFDMLHPFVAYANEQAGWNFQWDFSEDMQYTKYGKKQFYGWHADSDIKPYTEARGQNFAGKIRKLSMTVNLSDPKDYTGGNLRFDLGPHNANRYYTCSEMRPRGSIIVFPSHIHHQVTPVKSGIRRSLVMWSVGLPFR